MRRKAFTLVELLAVIVILAIIAVITVPMVSKVINNSRANTFKISLEQLLKVAQNDYQSNARIGEIKYILSENTLTCSNCSEGQLALKYSGDLKEAAGYLTINDTVITMDISNNRYKGTYEQKEDKDKGKIGKVVVTVIRTDADKIKDNLIVNGYGNKNNNSNFTGLTWDATNKNLYTTTSSYTQVYSNEYIPIDPKKTYYQSVTAKSNNASARYYIGIQEFDEDKNFIDSYNVGYIKGSLTTLAKDLKNGDTVVYLKSTAGFNNTTTNTGQLGLIFWNYKTKGGTSFSPESYSRNVWLNLYLNTAINKTNNTITLKTAWNKGTVKAGTEVSQSSAFSGTYNYGVLSFQTLTNSYKTFSNKIQGYYNYGDNVNKKFRRGTKYIRFLVLNNYTPAQANATLYLKDIVFEEFVDE